MGKEFLTPFAIFTSSQTILYRNKKTSEYYQNKQNVNRNLTKVVDFTDY